jgi:hypothetical protein
MQDLIGPDIRTSVFAHVLHVLLIGGMIVYGWLAISALTREPGSMMLAIRRILNGAWLGILFLVLTRPNPLPYLRFGAVVALGLIAYKLWDRFSAPAERKELTS